MRTVIITAALLAGFIGNSQTINNLVPNPSFEDFTNCPTGMSQLGNLDYWLSYMFTPDAFNACAPLDPLGYSTPLNYRGFQYPANGNGYIGMVCYMENSENFREIARVDLIDTLIVGQTYFASFKVNLANSQNAVGGSLPVATNRIGMHLTTSLQTYNWQNLPNYSHLFANSVVADTANWITISGSFLADSAYTQLYLGNLFIDDSLTVVDIDASSISYNYSFIDDIYIGNDELTISSITPSTIAISPNPVVDQFTIKLPGTEQWSILVVNNCGGVILNQKYNGNTLTLNIEEFDPGIYTVVVEGPSSILKKRLVKI